MRAWPRASLARTRGPKRRLQGIDFRGCPQKTLGRASLPCRCARSSQTDEAGTRSSCGAKFCVLAPPTSRRTPSPTTSARIIRLLQNDDAPDADGSQSRGRNIGLRKALRMRMQKVAINLLIKKNVKCFFGRVLSEGRPARRAAEMEMAARARSRRPHQAP